DINRLPIKALPYRYGAVPRRRQRFETIPYLPSVAVRIPGKAAACRLVSRLRPAASWSQDRMSAEMEPLPGNARYYERHVYPRLTETLALSPYDPASTLIDWIVRMGVVDVPAEISVLEVGC